MNSGRFKFWLIVEKYRSPSQVIECVNEIFHRFCHFRIGLDHNEFMVNRGQVHCDDDIVFARAVRENPTSEDIGPPRIVRADNQNPLIRVTGADISPEQVEFSHRLPPSVRLLFRRIVEVDKCVSVVVEQECTQQFFACWRPQLLCCVPYIILHSRQEQCVLEAGSTLNIFRILVDIIETDNEGRNRQ